MSNLFSRLKLQSPLWQGIGAIVSIVALITSSFIAYDVYQKSNRFSDLTVEYSSSFNPVYSGKNPSKRIAMSINGEEIHNAKVYYYTVKNNGNVPITLNDYVEPITISVKKPFRILTVEKEGSNRDSIKTVWNKIDDNNFQLKPLLLNPNDRFDVLVFISRKPEQVAQKRSESKTEEEPAASNESANQDDVDKQEKAIPEPKWTARIINISDLKFAPNYRQKREAEAKALGIFYTSFYQAGWDVYKFAVIVFILFIFGLFLGVQFGVLQQKTSTLHYVLTSVLMGLSVVAGDNITSRLSGMSTQPLISDISLFLYFLLIGLFTFPALRKSSQKKSSINNP